MKILYIVMLFSMAISCKKENSNTKNPGTVVTLGAILDLSGNYSEEGLTGKAALELAIDDLNQRYTSVGSSLRFSVTYVDTHLDTGLTLNAAKNMYNQGIRLLVAGPNNSAGLNTIKSFVDQHQMLVVNCFSSAPSLAIPDDYIIRLITDDNMQGQALLKMMQYDTIQALIPVWRNDTYGTGLYQAVKQKFQDQGGTIFPGISYNPGASNYQEMIQQVGAQVSNAIATYGNSRVAVILIGYQEGADFLHAAASVHDLALVKWYGCDANIQKTAISSDTVAAPFARTVRFMGPIMGIGTAGKLPAQAKVLSDRIFAKTGLNSTAYALTAYDAVQLYSLAYDIVQDYNAPMIRTAFPPVCEFYNYLGISRKLNAAGDLATANYIFWTIIPASGGYGWDSYATYIADGDYILIK
ncbi:MAG: ABC transporter substrate-binding protein [Bacteroidales bacterium]